ncbi:MAG: hypothetical protein ACOY4O_06470 [Pseudomonadota bacterium]
MVEFFHLMPRNAGLRNVNRHCGGAVFKYFERLSIKSGAATRKSCGLRRRLEAAPCGLSRDADTLEVPDCRKAGAVRAGLFLCPNFALAAGRAGAQNSLLTIMTNKNSYIWSMISMR